ALRLIELGVDEVCFGDTIGVGVPAQVEALTARAVDAGIAVDRIAYHFHDTRGTALANVVAGLAGGIRCLDEAVGATGGCPYAPGAAGNLATEDRVYLLDASGFEHGVDLERVLVAARFVAEVLGRPLATKVGQAGGWDPATGQPVGRWRPTRRGQSSESANLYHPARDGRRRARAEPELRAAQRLQPATGLPARVRREGRSDRVRPPGNSDAADGIPRALRHPAPVPDPPAAAEGQA